MQDILKKAKEFGTDKIADYTEGVNFPASKRDIVDHAKKNNMPPEIVKRLEKLPDKEYKDISDLVVTTVKESV